MQLEKITLFEAQEVVNEIGNVKHVGYRYTKASAELLAKGKGWWSGNGKVAEKTLYTDGNRLYQVEDLGELPKRNDELEKAEVLDSIRKKLSPTELEALGLKGD